jgi:hypothetical protein
MSYTTFPSATFAAAPGVNDDTTKGYVVGSQWTDTSVSPRVIYLCTNASAGAAVWVNAGGVTAHTGLTALGWTGSGHTGANTSVAGFTSGGAAQTIQATADGQVLTRVAGALVFAAVAASAAVIPDSTKTLEILYLAPTEALLPSGLSSEVGPGVFA